MEITFKGDKTTIVLRTIDEREAVRGTLQDYVDMKGSCKNSLFDDIIDKLLYKWVREAERYYQGGGKK